MRLKITIETKRAVVFLMRITNTHTYVTQINLHVFFFFFFFFLETAESNEN